MSLVEVVVVLAIFLFVIDAVIGLFVVQVRQQKNVLKDQDVLNQIDYDLEYLSRAIRLAIKDSSGCLSNNLIYSLTHIDNAPGFYQGIKFFSTYDNACHDVYLDSDGILKELKSTNPSGLAVPILAPNDFNTFSIKYARFILDADPSLGSYPPLLNPTPPQPRVTIAMSVLIPTDLGQKERIFQTTVSKRHFPGSVCGDGICNGNEDCNTCFIDCPIVVCPVPL